MRISAALLGLVCLASPCAAARRRPLPPAAGLLEQAVALPSAPFSARERVQVFGPSGAAGKAKAQMREVRYSASCARRIEAAGRKGEPTALLIVDDGRRTLTAWPKAGRAWLAPDAAVDPAAEKARLESLYDLSVSSGGRVARKATWRLDLRSKKDGRLRRSVWIEKNGGLVLRREDFRPDGTLLRRIRTTRLETAEASPGAFVLRPPDGTALASSTVPFAGAALPAGFRFPAWLPDGFVLLDADGEAAVYTDGLVRFTVDESAAGGRRAAVDGDLPEADLARIADSIPEGR